MGKRCIILGAGPYSGNRQIGFNASGENYQSGFSLLSILGLSLEPPKKRGRPKGSKDSYKRIRRY